MKIRNARAVPILTAALILAVLIQSWVAVTELLLPLREDVLSVQDLPIEERSAILAFGDDFAGFMRFLREEIPSDSVLAIPPMAVEEVYGNSALIGFFLYPRTIQHCRNGETVLDCASRLEGDAVHILVTRGFRIEQDELQFFRSYKGSRGLYVP